MRKLPNILIIKLDFLFIFLLKIFFLKVPVTVLADKLAGYLRYMWVV